MPDVTAVAPGKIILFGEHAVVYGQPAIAVPLNQVRARAMVSPGLGRPAGEVFLDAPAIGLAARLDELPAGHPLGAAVRLALAHLGIERPPALRLRIVSSIPVASGLGSGAAVSVAAIRALCAFLGRPLPDAEVCALAYEVEKIHHGAPSGIDNTVITYAMPVYFVRGRPIETFHIQTPFTLVIGDSGVAAPTALSVSDVRTLWQAEPARYEAIFSEIGGIARSARQAIESGRVAALGPLMDANQALLQALTVSSPELDLLVEAARAAGALGAKLSGGGRGGNMLALVEAEAAPRVAAALTAAGAKGTLVTRVGENH